MIYIKIQSQSFLGSGVEDFKCFCFISFFLLYMGMVVILFNGVEPLEQTVNIPLTKGSI